MVERLPTNLEQADGRDSERAMMTASFRKSREIYVPRLENGSLHYTIMEIVTGSDIDSGWAVKRLDGMPTEPFPAATGPSIKDYTALNRFDFQRFSMTVLAGGGRKFK